jgi:type VI protein secretion system component VasF
LQEGRDRDGIEAALGKTFMALRAKSRKILIPDVPPVVRSTNRQGLVIASLGVFCMSVVLAAVLFVFLSA